MAVSTLLKDPAAAATQARPVPSLPASWYHDPAIWRREQEAIFWREWLMVGCEDELPAPGSYIAASIAGRPVFVIRDRDGTLRGFHNVCRHRAASLVDAGTGRCDVLRCRYHGWLYDMQGRLRATPDFGDDPPLDRAEHSLFPIRVANWRRLVFVNLDLSAPPVEEGLGGLVGATADLPLESYRYHGRKVYDLEFNWKNYVDNYMEGMHIPYLHPGLNAALDVRAYRVTPGDRIAIHRATARDGADYQGLFMWRYPNNTIGVYASGLNVTRIVPLGPRSMQLVIDFFFPESAGLGEEERRKAMACTCEVVEEDFAMCRAVQQNLETGVYDTGPLSPKHENGVAYFHELVRGALAGPD